MQKVFLTKTMKASFSCPECGRIRQMDVSKFSGAQKVVRFKCKCSCKNEFTVVLERRRHVRRSVDLKGILKYGPESCPVKVVDISRLGMLLSSQEPLELKSGDKVVVEFTLDDAGESHVTKDVTIQAIKDKDIGVKFLSLNHYDKLGPYLLFHFE